MTRSTVRDLAGEAHRGIAGPLHGLRTPLMIGLSVAVGRFVEALFWAIFRVAGVVAGVALLAVLAIVAVWLLYRRTARRR